ncbi:MAG: DUF1772 domain-containing protein [Actinomycetota bacterium]|nr:DUF1772 domain-containing protein [Actinomycetota bacterium]
MDTVTAVAAWVAALGSGLMAGVFFAFSTFVMAGLTRLPPAQGLTAMQSINRTASHPLLMAALFGTALACLVLMVRAMANWGDPGLGWVLAGSAFYVVGAFGVTLARHVPMNLALERVKAEAPDAAGRWTGYAASWTRWNHLRAVGSLGAAGLLTVALMQS